MTAPRDPDRLIRAFLDEGRTELPDRAFDEVRRDIHATRQRVVIGPWREPDMSILARVAIAAAAVLAIGVAWVNLAPPRGGVGAPQPSPSVSPSASPGASIANLATYGPIAPGRYRLAGSVAGTSSTPRLVITLPAGWATEDGVTVFKNYGAQAGLVFGSWIIDGTVVDPCTDHTSVKPKPGPGVDELAQALAHQAGTTSVPPAPVTVGGYRGKVVELTVTADISKCGNGVDGFWIWTSPDGDRRYVQDTNEVDRIYILDVGGQRYTFNADFAPRTTAADRAELETILGSITIEPRS